MSAERLKQLEEENARSEAFVESLTTELDGLRQRKIEIDSQIDLKLAERESHRDSINDNLNEKLNLITGK